MHRVHIIKLLTKVWSQSHVPPAFSCCSLNRLLKYIAQKQCNYTGNNMYDCYICRGQDALPRIELRERHRKSVYGLSIPDYITYVLKLRSVKKPRIRW